MIISSQRFLSEETVDEKKNQFTVEFEVVEHEAGLTGEELLNAEWMDSDYYDIQTGKNVW